MSVRWLAVAGVLAFCGAVGMSAQVKVWEGTMTLAASDDGPANTVPPFAGSKFGPNYPYANRDDLRPTESQHTWRAVFLENEYLKCTVLPDVGGHVYTCVDKINGVPMFYANPTLKKALISYRGAWAAFGEEFNFPVSHNWMTLSPVDFAKGMESDGSAWVEVGNRDRVEGLQWTVQMVLRPGSTVLEERVTLENPGDVRQRYYWWNNAGVEVWNDSRIWYPMHYTMEDQMDRWPMNREGLDLSVVGNATSGPVALFAYGSNEGFMGIYNPHTDAGIVHYADPKEVPGKKIWSWGVNNEGLQWRKDLSDNNSAYVEVQSGLFQDQDTYRFLAPGETRRFTEYWMPVRGIGTITRGNLNGVVSMDRHGAGKDSVVMGLNVNRVLEGAKVTLRAGDEVALEEAVTLDPAKTWKREVKVDPAKTYTFALADAQGKMLLEHTENKFDLTPLKVLLAEPEAATPEGVDAVLAQGEKLERRGSDAAAWDVYQAGLKKYKRPAPLLLAAGRLGVKLLRFSEAAELLAGAVKAGVVGMELHYYLGLADDRIGHGEDAKRELELAAADPGFRVRAGVLLAEMAARGGAVANALKRLQGLCAQGDGDQRCVEESVALIRMTGDASGAKAMDAEGLKAYPTSGVLQHEAAKLGVASDEEKQRLAGHLGADSERALELASAYGRVGMAADAVEVLSQSYPRAKADEMDAGALAPGDDPLVAYARGYFRQKMGQSGKVDFAAAGAMKLEYVFPNREDSLPVLQAAVLNDANDASAHVLLGMLWYSRRLDDAAMEEWKKAEALNPKLANVYVMEGMVPAGRNERAAAVAMFERGIRQEPSNAALYVALDSLMKKMEAPPAQREKMLESYPAAAGLPGTLVRALVTVLRQDGKGDVADRLLAQYYVPAKEGDSTTNPGTAMSK